jgi:hypothetical protein
MPTKMQKVWAFLTPELYEALCEERERTGATGSVIIRRALTEYLRRRDIKKA